MRILTGIQPTNTIHIGNLFGALLPTAERQTDHELLLMIPNYHAITVDHDPEQLKKNTLFLTATYLAAGIDPSKTIIFKQSDVSAHTELGWIMQTITQMGEAERMTQYKDKSDGKARVSVSLFTYPTLQAADILLYDAEGVPVGADQKQHIELTRNLAERFNNRYGETFVVPEHLTDETSAKLLSLTEPEKKMSKSAPSAKSYISVMDDAEVIEKKIRSAVTDSISEITADKARAGVYNLLSILAITQKRTVQDVAADFKGMGMKDLKEAVSRELIDTLSPLKARIESHINEPEKLQRILTEGAQKARQIADKKLHTVKEKLGLLG